MTKNIELRIEIESNDVLNETTKKMLLSEMTEKMHLAPADMKKKFYQLQELPLVLTLFSDKDEEEVITYFKSRKTEKDNYVKKKLNQIKSTTRGTAGTVQYWQDYIKDLHMAVLQKQALSKKKESLKAKDNKKK